MNAYLKEHRLTDFDVIIPVPNHEKSIQNVAAVSICDKLSKIMEIPSIQNALKKTKQIRSREISYNHKIEFFKKFDLYILNKPQNFSDKKILLVDDIQTTAHTLRQCLCQLAEGHPRDITVITAGKTY
jgi:competence protein ComFC